MNIVIVYSATADDLDYLGEFEEVRMPINSSKRWTRSWKSGPSRPKAPRKTPYMLYGGPYGGYCLNWNCTSHKSTLPFSANGSAIGYYEVTHWKRMSWVQCPSQT